MKIVESIKNFFRYSSVGARVGVVTFLLFDLIVIVVAVVILTRPAPGEDSHVEITNFDEVAAVPEDYQTNVQNLIWKAIESNDVFKDVVFTDAVVRADSYNEVTNGEVVTAKFIVDIESMHYSFAVTASWQKGNTNVDDKSIYVECPHYLDVIYTDTKCIAMTPEEQVGRYLPHYDYVGDGRLLSVTMRQYDTFQERAGEPYLAIEVNACGNESLLEAGKTATVKWLKSIYLDPNDYYMETLDVCR
ncbi:hypothetical protein IJF93_02780 [Candidatus Saccharibacteria bacterium]|nr:hypothetical protein [Candidatus Saccharibacteria bacterium]